MNTMNVSYSAKMCDSFTKKHEAIGQVNETNSFNEKVSNLETGKTETIATKEMTMEEYKQYIHNQISQIPMHPTRLNESISLQISEEGFKAMKNDSEYEAWVLNDLKTGWSQPDQWAGICGGAFSTIYYGATKEECHAEMWSKGYQEGNGNKLFDKQSENNFWEKRLKRKKMLQEQYDEQMEKKSQARKLQQELIDKKISNTDLLNGTQFSNKSTQNINQAFKAYDVNMLVEDMLTEKAE